MRMRGTACGRDREGLLSWLPTHAANCWVVNAKPSLIAGHAVSVALLRVVGNGHHKDYSHRRDWIVRREEHLAGLFAIDIEFRAELSNHLHNVLRTLPRVARRWSAHEPVDLGVS